ncbi:MAG: glycosyltransferase [Candidatus Helarchaeota archaeon]|nr:glycosyltransferase [Candidatus Helarchaeota archaeon]
MKTVIHYTASAYLPITQTWIYGQIKNFKRYRPIVYAPKTQNLDIYPTEKIRSLELKKGIGNLTTFFNKGWHKLFNFYPYFIFALIKDKPDLVHAHFGPSGYDFLRLKSIFKFPLITSFYGYDLSRLPRQHSEWKTKYRKLFQKGDYFLVEGPYMKRCLVELGCPGENIIIQHLGINLERVKFMLRKPTENGEVYVLVVGNFREKKGIPYAVEAFGRVKQACPQLKLGLTIIGGSSSASREEKEKGKILRTIRKYKLNDCVKMMGYQPYPIFLRELYEHHVFLSPSIHASDGDIEGGAPVSIVEASASGMPVLSTTHCDIPEVVINGESGYLVSERNVDALAEKLEFLVSNPDMWEGMGKRGREHIKKNYSVITQVQKLEEIYDTVVKKE